MTKKLAIPEGNLLRVAAMKGITTLSALEEKTGVDRKTLRAINRGQPFKERTLQAIADKLQIPLAHFFGPSTLDEVESSSSLAPVPSKQPTGIISRDQVAATRCRRAAPACRRSR